MEGLSNSRIGPKRKELIAPCKDCKRPEKKPGCHDHCGDYHDYQAVNAAKNAYFRKRAPISKTDAQNGSGGKEK